VPLVRGFRINDLGKGKDLMDSGEQGRKPTGSFAARAAFFRKKVTRRSFIEKARVFYWGY
jgi:hypothetical protein